VRFGAYYKRGDIMNIEHGKFYIEIPNVAVSEKIQLALFKRGDLDV
jgi:hypothetical protein